MESLIFASDKALQIQDLRATLNTHFKTKVKEKEIVASIESLQNKYLSEDFAFEVICINGGYQFMTKGAYHPVVGQHLRLESKKKLSKAALETLAIISYKQPATKSHIESIRGVNCDYSIQKLLEKELIEMKGRAEGPGRPLIYGTSPKFMNHFGLQSLNELPKLKEFDVDEENSIGLIDEDSDDVDISGAKEDQNNNEEHVELNDDGSNGVDVIDIADENEDQNIDVNNSVIDEEHSDDIDVIDTNEEHDNSDKNVELIDEGSNGVHAIDVVDENEDQNNDANNNVIDEEYSDDIDVIDTNEEHDNSDKNVESNDEDSSGVDITDLVDENEDQKNDLNNIEMNEERSEDVNVDGTNEDYDNSEEIVELIDEDSNGVDAVVVVDENEDQNNAVNNTEMDKEDSGDTETFIINEDQNHSEENVGLNEEE